MPDKNAESVDKGNLAGSIAGSVLGADVGNKMHLGAIGGIAASVFGSGQGSKAENKIKEKMNQN
ncbi:LAME_0B01486g1_1 [Lachancea meyersii CBS 8951]|uniref:LAME_0B01486g1_1 n=1 Tax=Lachancea meyersii CBS 8951 TaxID=1266667 RepID=A0A1G4ITQ8_9SACH|nr:LAME_0B01486g1_1 [Lachancea meyersii CBS 8951]